MLNSELPITLESSRCNGCGLCVSICHERAMQVRDGKVAIDATVCSTCSQCIAVCPERALSWHASAPRAREPQRLPTPEQLDELFKERRSVRAYTEERLARCDLEAIATYAAYAPTNNYALRIIIVDDPALLQRLESLALSVVRGIYRVVFKHRFLFAVFARLPFAPHADVKDRVKVIGTVERRHNIFHAAPALLLVVGDGRTALSSDSAQYSLANVIFAAEVRGIASCLSGSAKTMLGRHPRARQLLGLRSHERILGALTLGKPASQFANNVEGKHLPIQWNGQP